MLDNLANLEIMLDEINRLKDRSVLLEKNMNYYDEETMTFIIPEKWKNNPKKLPAESPRHLMHDNIKKYLSEDELHSFNIFN